MITLHIEDTAVRLMEVDGRQITKVASLPLESGLVESGVVLDKAVVSQLIRELLASQGISDKQVVASISGIHAIYRTVTLPRLTRNLVDEAARHELGRTMPVSLAELYTSWQAIDVSAQETVLCMTGLPKNTVDAMLETLRQAGLKCIGMDITPLALARISDEKDAIVINVQPRSFNIVAVANGIPELVHTLTFPSGDMTTQDKIKLVKEELERTVTFYNSSHKESPFTTDTAIFISGELRELLVNSLSYRVKPLPNWLSSRVRFDVNEFTTNVGLALKQVRNNRVPIRVNIDVRPAAFLPKPRPTMVVAAWAVLALAIIILVPLILMTQKTTAETLALTAKVDAIQTQVQSRQPANAFIKLLQANVDTVKSAQKTYDAALVVFKAQHARVNGDLGKITSLLPGTMNLTSISYSSDALFIHGNAPDKTTILNYSKALRDTGRFKNVIISDMHEIDYRRWAFILAME